MATETIWLSANDLVTGDPSLQVSYPSVSHPAVEISSTTPGDLKWVYLPIDLPPCVEIKALHVCYQLTNNESFISQVRLTEMQTPDQALVQHDDPENLISTDPTCYVSNLNEPYRPEGAVTLQLRLDFNNTFDKIILGAIGVELEAFQFRTKGVIDIRKFGAKIDGITDDSAAINAAINALPGNGGSIVIPYGETGECAIENTILINKKGVRLLGVGPGRIRSNPRLVWKGGQVETFPDGSIEAGSRMLTSGTSTFTAGDEGKLLEVKGAGIGGVPLCAAIDEVINPTACNLAIEANTAVNAAEFWFGERSIMIKVENGNHGASIENLVLHGNLLADHCLHLEVLHGSSTHDTDLSRLHFENYRKYGLVLGEPDCHTLKNGQLRVVTADHLVFTGGVPGASGILLNAQNAEFVNFYSLNFGVRSMSKHQYHIIQISGGIQIFGFASTRATNYAIVSRSQLGIYGWRSEDRYLVQQQTASPPPSTFVNISQRKTDDNLADDVVFDLNHKKSPQTLQSIRIQGSIRVGGAGERHVNAQGVKFELPEAGYILSGRKKNQRGIFHDSTTGKWELRGESPSIDFRLSQETSDDPVTPAGTLTGVKGISSMNLPSKNLCGLATISNGDTSAKVPFDEAEPDANYHVVATVNDVSDSVPSESYILYISNKKKTGFRINVGAPPGEGNEIVVAWILVR